MSDGNPVAPPVHHPDPYFDGAGRFIHYCWCGKWGSFGVGCFPREGKLGKYYCAEHRLDQPLLPVATTPTERTVLQVPDLQALVARFGGYDKITPEAWAEWDRVTGQYRDDILNGRTAPQTRAEAAE
jgi:hypothetical protein